MFRRLAPQHDHKGLRHSERPFYCHSEGRKSRRISKMFRRLAPQHDHKGLRHSERSFLVILSVAKNLL